MSWRELQQYVSMVWMIQVWILAPDGWLLRLVEILIHWLYGTNLEMTRRHSTVSQSINQSIHSLFSFQFVLLLYYWWNDLSYNLPGSVRAALFPSLVARLWMWRFFSDGRYSSINQLWVDRLRCRVSTRGCCKNMPNFWRRLKITWSQTPSTQNHWNISNSSCNVIRWVQYSSLMNSQSYDKVGRWAPVATPSIAFAPNFFMINIVIIFHFLQL